MLEVDPQKTIEHGVTLVSALGLNRLIDVFLRRDEIKTLKAEVQKQMDEKLPRTEFEQCKNNEAVLRDGFQAWMKTVESKVDENLKATGRVEGYLEGLDKLIEIVIKQQK